MTFSVKRTFKFGSRCLVFALSLCLVFLLSTHSAPYASAQKQSANKHWANLPHRGLNGVALAMLVDGKDLIVAGGFTETLDGEVQNLNHIARFSNGAWRPFPNGGLNGEIFAMAKIRNTLYVGGIFTATADGAVKDLNNIAKFEDGVWQALPGKGLNGEIVEAMIEFRGDLYVGGGFTRTADDSVRGLNYVARLRQNKWQPLPNGGLDADAWSFASIGNILYVAGAFDTTADKQVKHLHSIARLHISDPAILNQDWWEQMPNDGFNDFVSTLAVLENDLYAVGQFTHTHDHALKFDYVAKFSGNRWYPLPPNGAYISVTTILSSGKSLYIGGQDGARVFRGGKWHRLPRRGAGLAGEDIYVFAKVGNDLYASGDFLAHGTATITNYIKVLTAAP